MAMADRVVAATEVDRSHMLEAYTPVPANRGRPGGVNLDLFGPGDRQAARGRSASDRSRR